MAGTFTIRNMYCSLTRYLGTPGHFLVVPKHLLPWSVECEARRKLALMLVCVYIYMNHRRSSDGVGDGNMVMVMVISVDVEHVSTCCVPGMPSKQVPRSTLSARTDSSSPCRMFPNPAVQHSTSVTGPGLSPPTRLSPRSTLHPSGTPRYEGRRGKTQQRHGQESAR